MTDNSQSSPAARSAWSVLRYRDFRLMYMAQFFATTGAAMQLAAVNWHIWSLTKNEAALGLVGLVRVIPIVALSLLGGVISDAVDRRRLLLLTQTATLICAAILALSALNGSESLVLIYVITATIAGLGAFDSPARFALLPMLVPSERVADTARLNVVLFTTTSVFGPLIAGELLKRAGPGAAYAVNALMVIPTLLALLMIRIPIPHTDTKREISLTAMREGLNFVRRSPLLWSSMLLDFVATFFASALQLLPVYADRILHVGVDGYSQLLAAPFVGSALGAIIMAQYGGRVKRQGELMLWAVGIFGAATVIFGFSTNFYLSMLALAVTGLADSLSAAVRSALRNVLTPSRLRGRMQSVMMVFFLGGPQLGEFEAGVLARLTTPVFSVVSGGVATVIAVGLMTIMIPALREYREVPTAAAD